MSRRGRFLVAAALVALAGGCGDGDEPNAGEGPVSVDEAWARATVPAARTGAVYLVLESVADDALVGVDVSTAVAAGATLHQTVLEPASTGHDGHDADMVTMSGLDELPLPAGEDVALEPGGAHVMLTELAEPLVAGSTFELTLRFATAEPVGVTVEVREDP